MIVQVLIMRLFAASFLPYQLEEGDLKFTASSVTLKRYDRGCFVNIAIV